MEYVIPLVLVLLLVGGFVTFLVLNATRRGQSATRAEEPKGPPGVGRDETPLGDTAEHAGEQSAEGRTVGPQDAAESGGTGQPVHSGYEGTSAAGHDTGRESAHVRRSGEGEGTERLEFADVEPPHARDGAGGQAGARAAGQGERDAADRDERAGERERSDEERRDEERVRPESERLADRGF